jgi:hypothetical protein
MDREIEREKEKERERERQREREREKEEREREREGEGTGCGCGGVGGEVAGEFAHSRPIPNGGKLRFHSLKTLHHIMRDLCPRGLHSANTKKNS